MKIEKTKAEDIADMQKVLRQTELFPAEILPDMLDAFLNSETSSDIWLSCRVDNQTIGFCYAAPEQLTDGTWNMLAIAVLPNEQSKGVGKTLVQSLENMLRKQNQRIVIVDTSGTDEFSSVRTFYGNIGYEQEARIRDFWAIGDDKIIFRKAL